MNEIGKEFLRLKKEIEKQGGIVTFDPDYVTLDREERYRVVVSGYNGMSACADSLDYIVQKMREFVNSFPKKSRIRRFIEWL